MRSRLLCLVVATGCGSPVASLTLDPKVVELTHAGETAALKPSPLDAKGKLVPRALLKVVWSSSDPQVASVVYGTVTALRSGSAVITASVEDVSTTAEVTVSVPASVSLSTEETEIVGLGKTADLTATVRDDHGREVADAVVRWSTASSTVAKITHGRVEAVGIGRTTVTASLGALSAAAVVRVRYPRIARIDVTPKEGVLWFARAGQSTRVSVTLRDADGRAIDDVPYAWSSSAPETVAVTPDGVVTALGKGKATLLLETPEQSVELVARVLN